MARPCFVDGSRSVRNPIGGGGGVNELHLSHGQNEQSGACIKALFTSTPFDGGLALAPLLPPLRLPLKEPQCPFGGGPLETRQTTETWAAEGLHMHARNHITGLHSDTGTTATRGWFLFFRGQLIPSTMPNESHS